MCRGCLPVSGEGNILIECIELFLFQPIDLIEKSDFIGKLEAGEIGEAVLRVEIEADAVRISTIDSSEVFMESQAMELQRSSDGMLPTRGMIPANGMIPVNGTMVLSLMPRHEEVIRTARTIQARTGDSIGLMSEMEMNQLFDPSVRTACLVPISGDNRVIGIVSLSARSESGQFKEHDILFAASVAEILAMAARQSPEGLTPMQPALPQNTLDTRISRFLQEEQSTFS